MNKNILWGSIAVVVVVIFVWLQFSNEEVQTVDINNVVGNTVQDSNNNANTTKTSPVSNTIKSTPTKTFTNILPKVGNYQCDYEEVTQSTRSTNTVYLADGKMRAEFRSMNSAGVGSGNIMVYDGVNLYTWTEGKTTGTVSRPTSISDFPAIIPKDLVTSISLGSGLNSASWYCHAWAKDASLLQKPSYLKI